LVFRLVPGRGAGEHLRAVGLPGDVLVGVREHHLRRLLRPVLVVMLVAGRVRRGRGRAHGDGPRGDAGPLCLPHPLWSGRRIVPGWSRCYDRPRVSRPFTEERMAYRRYPAALVLALCLAPALPAQEPASVEWKLSAHGKTLALEIGEMGATCEALSLPVIACN